jgi:hypothetical protein
MVHFQTKGHLVAWLERHCPRGSIVRAINEGAVELLGGFSLIPPSNRSGWIVRITSRHKRVWLVAVSPNRDQNDYEIRLPKEVPWKHWCGDMHTSKLYTGDKPWLYAAIKERT